MEALGPAADNLHAQVPPRLDETTCSRVSVRRISGERSETPLASDQSAHAHAIISKDGASHTPRTDRQRRDGLERDVARTNARYPQGEVHECLLGWVSPQRLSCLRDRRPNVVVGTEQQLLYAAARRDGQSAQQLHASPACNGGIVEPGQQLSARLGG